MRGVIEVDVSGGPLGIEAQAHLYAGEDSVEIVARATLDELDALEEGELDDWESTATVVARLRRSLAHLGVRGCLEFVDISIDDPVVERALRNLPVEDRTITDKDVVRVREEAAKYDRKAREGFEVLVKAMQEEGLRRGITKEERAQLTLGQALDLGNDE